MSLFGQLIIYGKMKKYFDVEVDWLIEQAEKVNQLEEENKKLLEYAIDTRDGVECWNSKYKDSNKKLERYEKALKEIRDGLLESPYFDSFKVAKQALEESE